MAHHSSVDFSMPSAQQTSRPDSSPLSSAEVLARFEAEQQTQHSTRPLVVGSLVGLGLMSVVLGALALRSSIIPPAVPAAPAAAAAAVPGGSSAAILAAPTFINWNYSFEAAQQMAATQNKPMLVEFYTDWCSVCRGMDAGTYTDPAVIAETGNVVPVKINAEGRTDLAQRFGVSKYPTFVWLDAGGQERNRISGGFDAPNFLNLMQRNR